MTGLATADMFATAVILLTLTPAIKGLHEEEDRWMVAGVIVFAAAITWALLRWWRLI